MKKKLNFLHWFFFLKKNYSHKQWIVNHAPKYYFSKSAAQSLILVGPTNIKYFFLYYQMVL
jgi:hypothetical protein